MPGIRIMNNTGAEARDGDSRKRTYDGKLVNGEHGPSIDVPMANGASVNGASAPVVAPAALTTDRMDELPPEILHITSDNYHPLSKLLERISQECFNDLGDILRAMKDVPLNPPPNGVMPNGLGGHQNIAAVNQDANRHKKLLLMRFAQETRAKFIKLLVLTEWGKKSAIDIAKVIDIYAWTRAQSMSLDLTPLQTEMIKMLTAHARQTNPDIRTALEILSKGKAEWIPDMGLIPPKPLSAEKTLKLFRYMNTSLAIRLNLYENLPRHLKKWRIGSGRVTFIIDSEFELDVTSFSEDETEQWLFIDLRLLFTPAPTIPVGTRFQAYFKPQVDQVLKESGLSGCFDFLHNFVLTHKINVLKSQALQLTREGWTGSVKVEPVHRSLVLQYWTDRPGKKSWIEIGISSNRPKDGKVSWRGPPISSIAVRWFRHGVLVADADLNSDFDNLSMERILKQVISLHIAHFLKTTRDALSPRMMAKVSLSQGEPCDCTLAVSLGRPENMTTLSLEPVTGRFILRPCTSISAQAEQAINNAKDPLASTGGSITKLLALTLQDQIHQRSLQIGWQTQSGQPLRLDNVKAVTKLDVLHFSLFWPGGWTVQWALASVIDPSGETWWTFQLSGKGTKIETAEQLLMDKPGPRPTISRATLGSIERVAVQQLAFSSNRRELDRRGIRYAVRSEISSPSTLQAAPLRGWVLHLRTADLLHAKGGDAWLDPHIRILYQGFKSDYRKIAHIASGTMVKDVATDMQKLMSASAKDKFTFSENGNFSILLTTTFGEPIIDELKARLQDVDRLRSFTTTLHKRKMSLQKSSLQQVQFQYSSNLVATANFGKADNIQISFSPTNPHNRIKQLLSKIINEESPFFIPVASDKNGLDRFCTALIVTRPVLQALADIETATDGNVHNPGIRTHHIGNYRVTYENPMCSFDIRLQPKDDKVYWLIEDNDRKNNDSKPHGERHPARKRLETLRIALSAFFRTQRPECIGIRTGVLTSFSTVKEALKALHETVIKCAVKEGELPYALVDIPAPTAALPNASTNANGAGAVPQPSSRNNAPAASQRAPPAPVAPMAPTTSKPKLNFPNVGKSMNGGNTKQEAIELD